MQTLSALFRAGVTLAMIALPGFMLPLLWAKATSFYRLEEYLQRENIHASCLWAEYMTRAVDLRLAVSVLFVVVVGASFLVRSRWVSEGVCTLAIFLSSLAIACFALALLMAIPF